MTSWRKCILTRLLLPFIAALCLSPSVSWSSPLTDDLYNAQFERHWARFMPQYSWQWGKAQCYQESLLKPNAVSFAGAVGLCQFMPPTFRECVKRLRINNASPYSPYASILCNAWYMSVMDRIWKSPRPDIERLRLGQASYNAGAGNIIKAQRKCDDERFWQDISPCLHAVTGERNAHETKTYVQRIGRWYGELNCVR